ncbi:polymeric immunoglobulin receptor-like [Chelmon rostratus]|uniref:polymeric immunoglobulin receptor-like n=1 Tax=Chelmon rostratus TaxID=109905 RepID=UPI001BEC687B|nr:polymeric immunoglobulin receptor-like [Chelmon rostratus]
MNIHLAVFLCFSSGALCAIPTFTKTEGDTFSFGCSFNSLQGKKFLSKKERRNEDVLIETSGVSAQSGRYGIRYDTQFNIFYVSISQLSRSDSGRYRCGLGNASLSTSHRQFELRVTDAMCDGNLTLASPGITVCAEPEGGSIRVRCSLSSADLFDLFFCKDGCKKRDVLIETSGFRAQRGRYRIEYERNGVFHVTIANLTRSDSGLFRCGVNVPSSPNPCQAVEIRVSEAPTTSEPNSALLNSTSASAYEPTTHSFTSSSGSCTPATAFPPITTQSTAAVPNIILKQRDEERRAKGFIVPLVSCLAVFVVLLVVMLLVLYRKMRKRDSYGASNPTDPPSSEYIECATF